MVRISTNSSTIPPGEGFREMAALGFGCAAPLLAHYSYPTFQIADLTRLTRLQLTVGLFGIVIRGGLSSRDAKGAIWVAQGVLLTVGSYSLFESKGAALPLYATSFFAIGVAAALIPRFEKKKEIKLVDDHFCHVPPELPRVDNGWEGWYALIEELPELQREPYKGRLVQIIRDECKGRVEEELKILYRYAASKGRGLEWQIDLQNVALKRAILRELFRGRSKGWKVEDWIESWSALFGKRIGLPSDREADLSRPIDRYLNIHEERWLPHFRSCYAEALVPHWTYQLNRQDKNRLLQEVGEYFSKKGLHWDKLCSMGYFEENGAITDEGAKALLNHVGVIHEEDSIRV